MAQPTNTFDSYDAVGNREDLSDIVTNISPVDTPFMSMAGTAKATNTLHGWQTDSLAAADDSNAAIEGDEAAGSSLASTTRAENYTQISDKVVVVSGTQEAIEKAGRKSELAFQVVKAAKELKRDMEKIITGNQARVVGNSSTARKLRSLESWYTTNTNRATTGTAGVSGSTSAAATDGTQRAFTETLVKDVIQQVYVAGGNPDCIMLGPINKQVFSGFTGGATKFTETKDKALNAVVDIYVSDFGDMKVIPNRFQRDRTAHILQKDMWSIAYLQPHNVQDLAKTGNSMKKQVLAEYTLVAKNEAASGVVADLNVS